MTMTSSTATTKPATIKHRCRRHIKSEASNNLITFKVLTAVAWPTIRSLESRSIDRRSGCNDLMECTKKTGWIEIVHSFSCNLMALFSFSAAGTCVSCHFRALYGGLMLLSVLYIKQIHCRARRKPGICAIFWDFLRAIRNNSDGKWRTMVHVSCDHFRSRNV